MRRFEASPRRATPKGQTFINCTAPPSPGPSYRAQAPAFVAHPPDASRAPFPHRSPRTAFNRRSMRRFEASPRRATPKGQTFINCTAPPSPGPTYRTPAPAFMAHEHSRNSWSYFLRFSDMTTPHSACLHGFGGGSVYCLTPKGPSLQRPPEFADPLATL